MVVMEGLDCREREWRPCRGEKDSAVGPALGRATLAASGFVVRRSGAMAAAIAAEAQGSAAGVVQRTDSQPPPAMRNFEGKDSSFVKIVLVQKGWSVAVRAVTGTAGRVAQR